MMHLANLVAGSGVGTAAPSGPTSTGATTEVAAFLPQLQELLASAVSADGPTGGVDGDLLGDGGGSDVGGTPGVDQAIGPDAELHLGTWVLAGGHLVGRPAVSVDQAAVDLEVGASSDGDAASLADAGGAPHAAGGAASAATGAHNDVPTGAAVTVPGGEVATADERAATAPTDAAAARAVPATRAVPVTAVRGQASEQDGLVPGAHRSTPAVPAQPAVHQRDATRSPVLPPAGAEPSLGVDTTAASLPATAGAPARPSGGTGMPAAPVSSAAQRVLEALELLEAAPPPRQLTLELGEVRLRVALEDGQVRLTLLGERSAAADEALREARAELDARGFDRGRQRDGQARDGDGAPGPRRTGTTTSRRDDDLRL